MNSRARLLLCSIVAVALVFIITLSFAWGVAGYQAARSDYIVERWEKGGAVTEIEWTKAHALIQSALFWNKGQPAYLEAMAEIYHWRASQVNVSVEDLEQSVDRSLYYYRKAIASRPLWPYSWGNLVLLKAQLQQWDVEFDHAMNTALTLGAREASVQHAVHEAGLISWIELSDTQQQKILENYSNALQGSRNSVNKLMDINERYGRTQEFCTLAQQQVLHQRLEVLIIRRCK